VSSSEAGRCGSQISACLCFDFWHAGARRQRQCRCWNHHSPRIRKRQERGLAPVSVVCISACLVLRPNLLSRALPPSLPAVSPAILRRNCARKGAQMVYPTHNERKELFRWIVYRRIPDRINLLSEIRGFP